MVLIIHNEEFPGHSHRSTQLNEYRDALKKMEVGQAFAIPASDLKGNYHRIQQLASAESTPERKYRTRRQPNGDIKVYRVAV